MSSDVSQFGVPYSAGIAMLLHHLSLQLLLLPFILSDLWVCSSYKFQTTKN